MPSGRYGSGSSGKSSTEVELAEIRSELRSQGGNIAKFASKIDTMTDSLTAMTVQIGHLVTKESCANGRAALADELKKRMDSDREVTGVGVPVNDLVKHWVESKSKPSPTPIPYKSSRSSKSRESDPGEKKKWGIPTWIGLISGILAIVGASYGLSVFINNTIERQNRTEQVLIQIQEALVKGDDGPRKQAPVKTN